MTDLETRLEQALKADSPSPRDPMFRIELLLRRQRAAARRQVLIGCAAAFAAAILATLGLGVIDELIAPGPERLAAVATAGGLLAALLAAPFLGTLPALRRLAQRLLP